MNVRCVANIPSIAASAHICVSRLYHLTPHSRYAHPSGAAAPIFFRMMLPGLILALELSGHHDEELARRLQRRDPDAMKDLYDRFGRLAYSVVLAIVRDSAIAEDLVQETFLRVWNRIQGFEPGRGALGPWLLAIARIAQSITFVPRHRAWIATL